MTRDEMLDALIEELRNEIGWVNHGNATDGAWQGLESSCTVRNYLNRLLALTDSDGQPLLTLRSEWEHALQPTERDRASYIEDVFRPAEPLTEFLDGDCDIVPGISVEVMPGHTRHMQCVSIESRGQRAYFISDLVPTHVHLRYPWVMSFDLYPLETLANKRRLLPRLAAQQSLVVFPHDATLPCAVLEEREGKITARPAAEFAAAARSTKEPA